MAYRTRPAGVSGLIQAWCGSRSLTGKAEQVTDRTVGCQEDPRYRPGLTELRHIHGETVRTLEEARAEARRDPFDDLFRYHSPGPEEVTRDNAISQAARNFAEVVRATGPECSREVQTCRTAS
jgi:hypothetical protein